MRPVGLVAAHDDEVVERRLVAEDTVEVLAALLALAEGLRYR